MMDIAGVGMKLSSRIIIGALVAGVLLVFVLPPPWSGVLLIITVAAALVVGMGGTQKATARVIPRAYWHGLSHPIMLVIYECVFIIAVALIVYWDFVGIMPEQRVAGYELEWLTSSAQTAYQSLRDYGYLPLWQSYNQFGEPLIESPFSFVLNPISTAPSLIWGSTIGIRISAIVYGVFAGLGGYFLARVLRLGLAARLLLALLMIGKGNMLAMIGTGFFQLGVAQAYFPWVIGAAIATLRQKQRWSVVLLAIMLTLMFWAGNIWYMLPTVFALLALTIAHVLPGQDGRWNGAGLRRMVLAGVFTVGLAAVTLLPIFAHRDFIDRHTPEQAAGTVADLLRVASFLVGSETAFLDSNNPPYTPQFYYSFVVPLWFLLLIFLLLPPVGRFRSFTRSALPQSWRIWGVALFMLIGTFIWGVGGNPLMILLYDVLPGLDRWRFVGRALAVTSFWLALLVVLRLDSLWRLIFDPDWQRAQMPAPALRWVQINLGAALLFLAALAALQVNQSAATYARIQIRDDYEEECLRWLRSQYPDQPLTVQRHGYELTTAFLELNIRQAGIEADYAAVGLPSTLGLIDLTRSPAAFAMSWYDTSGNLIFPEGYEPIIDSPRGPSAPCMYRHPDPLSYAYSISLGRYVTATAEMLDASLTQPITTVQRLPDRIRLFVTPSTIETLIVTIQETAYPGWQVTVDGQPGALESVGGQIGVLIPPGEGVRDIVFAYRPPLFIIGGVITLLTAAVCMVYLLRRR
jgi:hypothetical protein